MGKEKKNPVHVVEGLRIRKKGTFSYKDIHGAVRGWFSGMGYTFSESKHVEKDGSSGREIESDWSGYRKVTGYVKFTVEVSIHLKDYKELDVEQDGKKLKTGMGRLEITFNADMHKNYGKVYSERKGEFSHFLKEIYEKYIARKPLVDYEDKLEAEVLEFYEGVKGLCS